MDQYKGLFLAESADYVQQITEGLLALEREPTDLAPVEVIFRGAHSLKGMSAAMGFMQTADLTHAMEGLMAGVRSGATGVDAQVVSAMLAAVDLARDFIEAEAAGKTGLDPSAMIARLDELSPAEDALDDDVVEPPARAVEAQDETPQPEPAAPGEHHLHFDVTLDESCTLRGVRAYMVLKRLGQLGHVVATVPSARDLEDERFERTFSVTVATALPAEAVSEAILGVTEVAGVALRESAAPAVVVAGPEAHVSDAVLAGASAPRLPRLADTQTVRVAIPRLDKLVDLVGEMVILRSRFDRLTADVEDSPLTEAVADLSRILSELQFEVMQTRMVPAGNVFNRFPRMVRDLAIELHKRVEFTMSGLDIELDRTVLDAIGDPLVHLLRNSIDHGIESAAEREAAGKPATGTITLVVSRERDHVEIDVTDDGAGMDAERVWAVACSRGLARPEEREEFTDSEVLQFTFVPGFSTATVTTHVSGRGVGLDVVKDRVEALGGTIQIASTRGEGSRFTLRLPLTLAIVKALLVECHGQPFALPLSAVNEVLSADEAVMNTVDGEPTLVLDGESYLLARLGSLLFGDPEHAPLSADSRIVLVTTAGEVRALVVDALLGRQEIVVKPLSGMFDSTRGFSGATILGDGRVMLILDPRTLFSHMEAAQ